MVGTDSERATTSLKFTGSRDMIHTLFCRILGIRESDSQRQRPQVPGSSGAAMGKVPGPFSGLSPTHMLAAPRLFQTDKE